MKKNNYNMNGISLVNVRNSNEKMVINEFQKIIKGYPDFCGCHICVEDVYALTLNSIKPKYQHNYSIVLKKEKSIDYGKKIRWFIKKVMTNPTHK